MIVRKDKSFNKMGLYPDTDWIGDADWVLDDDGNIADVTETEPAPVPPAPPTNAELAAAIAELAEVICGG